MTGESPPFSHKPAQSAALAIIRARKSGLRGVPNTAKSRRMIASLMMYARPELAPAHNRFWANIHASLADHGVAAPLHLSQNAGEWEVWESPALVFSQTCGMPYRTRLHTSVQLAGTPDYKLEDCPAGHYRSAIVVREVDPRSSLSEFAQAKLAYNMAHSQSGFAAIYTHTRPLNFWFAQRIASGGHLSSARMVATGHADVAAIDAQTWRLIQRYEDFAKDLRVLEYTAPSPALPYITGAHQNADTIFEAVLEAMNALSGEDARILDLHGLIRIPKAQYMAVSNPPRSASG